MIEKIKWLVDLVCTSMAFTFYHVWALKKSDFMKTKEVVNINEICLKQFFVILFSIFFVVITLFLAIYYQLIAIYLIIFIILIMVGVEYYENKTKSKDKRSVG